MLTNGNFPANPLLEVKIGMILNILDNVLLAKNEG